MTIDAKCLVCKNADRRRLIELGWNGGMGAATISDVLGGAPSGAVILRHLKQHTDGLGATRQVEVSPELPVRERITALQKLQLDEVERRIELAKHRAALMNDEHKDDEDWTPVDWSDFTDILGKDMQSAIGSILKSQGLTDKREAKTSELKLGLFEAMTKAGLAPVGISGKIGPGPLPEDPEDG